MRNKLGTICMVLGVVLLVAALSLLTHNQTEAAQAEQASAQLLPVLVEEIQRSQNYQPQTPPQPPHMPPELLEPEDLVMTEVEIEGYSYIGYLSIPTLELDLPIMADWDYDRLQIAPCRYTGTLKGEDLVLMAHNYAHHFGRLSELTQEDTVVFTDMDGNVTEYQVVVLDVLSPDAIEEMTAGDFDLTLFTCTYGGQSRITVYCNKVKNH